MRHGKGSIDARDSPKAESFPRNTLLKCFELTLSQVLSVILEAKGVRVKAVEGTDAEGGGGPKLVLVEGLGDGE